MLGDNVAVTALVLGGVQRLVRERDRGVVAAMRYASTATTPMLTVT